MNNIKKCKYTKNSSLLKTLLVIFVLFSGLNICFALDDARVAESLDTAFLRQSRAELTRILEQTKSTSMYKDVETYTIKKIRESLIFNRLEYAEFASLSLIEINLNNFEALDLYTRIGNALAVRQVQQKQEETVRLAQLEEEKKEAEPVIATIQTIETEFEHRVSADGQNIYFDLSQLQRFSPFTWAVNAKLASISLLSNPLETGLKYGLGIAGEFFYNSDSISIGAEVDLSAYIITLMGNENFVTDFSIIPAIAFVDLSEQLFFRLGFKGILLNSGVGESLNANLLSATIGIEWDKIRIGPSQSRICFDYLVGHISVPAIQTAFDLGLRTVFPISDQGNFTINALFDISDTFMIVSNNIENNAKFTIGIGVGNYE